MSSLLLDVRYALRMMAKTPELTAVLIIALGIGATTTIFSVVNSVILRPLPYEQPDRLVRVYGDITVKHGLPRGGLAVPHYHDLERSCHSCAAIAAWMSSSDSLAGGDRPVRIPATYATRSLQTVLSVQPVLGRWFDEREDRPGDPQAVVLGYDLWQRVFSGDPGILGRQLHLNARFPEREELFVPARLDYAKPFTTQRS